MSNETTNLVRYVVITSHYYWGKAETLAEAFKKAQVNSLYAFDSKKEKTNKAVVYRIELDPVDSVYNARSASELRKSGISLDGYDDGDLIEPWVNDWGNVGAWGAKIEKVIDLKIK